MLWNWNEMGGLWRCFPLIFFLQASCADKHNRWAKKIIKKERKKQKESSKRE
jgi:hypothetical protein